MAGMVEERRERLAEGLARMARGMILGGADHRALAEAPRSAWCDALGNALALEAFSHPLLAERYAALRTDIARFLVGMECAGALRRRAGPLRVAVLAPDTRRFHAETPSHVLTGDLGRALVRQALRAEPGRHVLLHAAPVLRFRHRGLAHRLDGGAALAACGIERFPGGVRLVQEACVEGRALPGLRRRALGTLRWLWELRADTPVLRHAVELRAADGVALEDVSVETRIERARGKEAPRFRLEDGVLRAGEHALHWRAEGTPHIVADRAGGMRRAGMRHPPVPVPAGGAARFTEERLLLTGAVRPDVAAIFDRRSAERGRDVALCPQAGWAAQAIAAALAWAPAEAALYPALGRIVGVLRAGGAAAGVVLAEAALARRGDGARRGEAIAALVAAAPQDALGLLALAHAALADAGARAALARALAAPRVPEDVLERALMLRALRAAEAARALGALPLEEDVAIALGRLSRAEQDWAVAQAARDDLPGAARAALLLALLAPDIAVMRPAARAAA